MALRIITADERQVAQVLGRFGRQGLFDGRADPFAQAVEAARQTADQEDHRHQHHQHQQQRHQAGPQGVAPADARQQPLGIRRPGADPQHEGEEDGADQRQQYGDAADDLLPSSTGAFDKEVQPANKASSNTLGIQIDF